jgi:hypothetical protein
MQVSPSEGITRACNEGAVLDNTPGLGAATP